MPEVGGIFVVVLRQGICHSLWLWDGVSHAFPRPERGKTDRPSPGRGQAPRHDPSKGTAESDCRVSRAFGVDWGVCLGRRSYGSPMGRVWVIVLKRVTSTGRRGTYW